jgi:hypothetical protein
MPDPDGLLDPKHNSTETSATSRYVRLTREQLYELVWAEPVTRLAKRWGVSDVAVAKWCRKLSVPRPGRGYWARVQAGHKGGRRPLPPARAGQRTEVCVSSGPERTIPEPTPVSETLPADLKELFLAFDPPAARIEVPAELVDPHKLVARTQSTFRNARADDGGILIARGRWHLDVQVTRETLDRALKILDALLKALEQRGIRVSVKDTDDKGQEFRRTTASVLGEKVEFDLSEKVQRSARPLTREEKQKLAKDPYYWIEDKYLYTPTGSLRLRIAETNLGFRASWSDGKRQQLEDHLNDFAKALILTVNKRRLDRAEAERRQRKWEEEARRRREAEKAWELESRQRKALDVLDERWRKSGRIREFVAAVQQNATEGHGPIDPESDLARWVEWAAAYADTLDPFKDAPFLALFERTARDVQLEPRRYW